MKTIHVVISGSVQGIGYRAFCKRIARKLGVTGWVKNRPDGSVEAELSGHEQQLNDMLLFLWQGPPLARITSIEQTTITPVHPHTSFVVLQ